MVESILPTPMKPDEFNTSSKQEGVIPPLDTTSNDIFSYMEEGDELRAVVDNVNAGNFNNPLDTSTGSYFTQVAADTAISMRESYESQRAIQDKAAADVIAASSSPMTDEERIGIAKTLMESKQYIQQQDEDIKKLEHATKELQTLRELQDSLAKDPNGKYALDAATTGFMVEFTDIGADAERRTTNAISNQVIVKSFLDNNFRDTSGDIISSGYNNAYNQIVGMYQNDEETKKMGSAVLELVDPQQFKNIVEAHGSELVNTIKVMAAHAADAKRRVEDRPLSEELKGVAAEVAPYAAAAALAPFSGGASLVVAGSMVAYDLAATGSTLLGHKAPTIGEMSRAVLTDVDEQSELGVGLSLIPSAFAFNAAVSKAAKTSKIAEWLFTPWKTEAAVDASILGAYTALQPVAKDNPGWTPIGMITAGVITGHAMNFKSTVMKLASDTGLSIDAAKKALQSGMSVKQAHDAVNLAGVEATNSFILDSGLVQGLVKEAPDSDAYLQKVSQWVTVSENKDTITQAMIEKYNGIGRIITAGLSPDRAAFEVVFDVNSKKSIEELTANLKKEGLPTPENVLLDIVKVDGRDGVRIKLPVDMSLSISPVKPGEVSAHLLRHIGVATGPEAIGAYVASTVYSRNMKNIVENLNVKMGNLSKEAAPEFDNILKQDRAAFENWQATANVSRNSAPDFVPDKVAFMERYRNVNADNVDELWDVYSTWIKAAKAADELRNKAIKAKLEFEGFQGITLDKTTQKIIEDRLDILWERSGDNVVINGRTIDNPLQFIRDNENTDGLVVVVREGKASAFDFRPRNEGGSRLHGTNLTDPVSQEEIVTESLDSLELKWSGQPTKIVDTKFSFKEIDTEPSLPQNLKGAKPKYGYGSKLYDVSFESDIDKAAYIVSNKSSKSAADDKYLKWVKDMTGMSDSDLQKLGASIKAELKEKGATSEGNLLFVKKKYAGSFTKRKVLTNVEGKEVVEGSEEWLVAYGKAPKTTTTTKKSSESLTEAFESGEWRLVEMDSPSYINGSTIGKDASHEYPVKYIMYRVEDGKAPLVQYGDIHVPSRYRAVPGAEAETTRSYYIEQVFAGADDNGRFYKLRNNAPVFSATDEAGAIKFVDNENAVVEARVAWKQMQAIRENAGTALRLPDTNSSLAVKASKQDAVKILRSIKDNIDTITGLLPSLDAITRRTASKITVERLTKLTNEVLSADPRKLTPVYRKIEELSMSLRKIEEAAEEVYTAKVGTSVFTNDFSMLPKHLDGTTKMERLRALMQAGTPESKKEIYESLVREGTISGTSGFGYMRKGDPLPGSIKLYNTGLRSTSKTLDDSYITKAYDMYAPEHNKRVTVPIDGKEIYYSPTKSIEKQLGVMIRHGAFDAWETAAKSRWMSRYGNIIEGFDPANPRKNINNIFVYGRIKASEQGKDIAKLAQMEREYILNQINIPTGSTKAVEDLLVSAGNKMYQAVTNSKSKFFDIPGTRKILKAIASGYIRQDAFWNNLSSFMNLNRVLNTHYFLGMLNYTQFFKQSSQAALIAGMNPTNAVGAFRTSRLLSKLLTTDGGGSGEKYLKFLVESKEVGSIEEARSLLNIVKNANIDPSTGSLFFTQGKSRGVASKSMTFFNKGEKITRLYALGMSIEDFKVANKRLPDFNNPADLVKIIDTKENYMFRMDASWANGALGHDHWAKTAFQFWTYPVRAVDLLVTGFNGKVSRKQRLALFGTMLALGGTDNLPGFSSINNAVLGTAGEDEAKRLMGEEPQSKTSRVIEEAWRDGLISAFLMAAFDVDVNAGALFSPTANVGSTILDTTDKSVKEFLLGPGYNMGKNIIEGVGKAITQSDDAYTVLMSMYGADIPEGSFYSVLSNTVSNYTAGTFAAFDMIGLSNFLKTLNYTDRGILMMATGAYIDKRGILVSSGPYSKTQGLIQALGFTPEDITRSYEIRKELEEAREDPKKVGQLVSQIYSYALTTHNPRLLSVGSVLLDGLSQSDLNEAENYIYSDPMTENQRKAIMRLLAPKMREEESQ